MVVVLLLPLPLLFSSTLSIPPPPNTRPLDIHINVDVAASTFDFASEWLTVDCLVTLAWKDLDNTNLPKEEEVVTLYDGDMEWGLDVQFMDMWMPPIKLSMEQDEFRRSRTKITEATFWRNGTVEIRFFYAPVIPCDQSSLWYPWDEFNCGLYLSNVESLEQYTLSPYNREKSFNIAYNRPMSHHKIIQYDSAISFSIVKTNDRFYRTHGVEFNCIVQRDQSRILYSRVIPALCLMFFDAYIYITNQSPLYCLIVSIPLLVHLQFFAALLVNKLPYLVMLLIVRTFLSSLTSIGRLFLSVFARFYPDAVKRLMLYDSPWCRMAFVALSTLIVFVALDYTQ